MVRGIQGSQVHFDFVGGARENGRAAAGTEKPPGIVACFAIDRHRAFREDRGSVKKGAVMLAAVEAVAKADPVWPSRRFNSDVAAQATTRESVHAPSPLKSSGRNVFNMHLAPARNTNRRDLLTSVTSCYDFTGESARFLARVWGTELRPNGDSVRLPLRDPDLARHTVIERKLNGLRRAKQHVSAPKVDSGVRRFPVGSRTRISGLA